jgi:hypothetical protein
MNSHEFDQQIHTNANHHIDIEYLTERLQEATPRKSKLSSYYDGFMAFAKSPPPLSPSPTTSRCSTPDPGSIDHSSDSETSNAHGGAMDSKHSLRPRVLKVAQRMSSLDSEDGRLIHERLRARRQHIKHRPKLGFRILKRQNSHQMRTRSKRKARGTKGLR